MLVGAYGHCEHNLLVQRSIPGLVSIGSTLLLTLKSHRLDSVVDKPDNNISWVGVMIRVGVRVRVRVRVRVS